MATQHTPAMVARLVAFIESHDPARVAHVGTYLGAPTIWVTGSWSDRDGNAFGQTDAIPATFSAARDWLGY